jgi:hypothetical protein
VNLQDGECLTVCMYAAVHIHWGGA